MPDDVTREDVEALAQRITELATRPGEVIESRGVLLIHLVGHEDLEALGPALAELHDQTGLMILLLEPGQTVESLDDEMMSRLGWVRSLGPATTLKGNDDGGA